MTKTISDTIIWLAKEWMKTEAYQDINSAIIAVKMEVSLHLQDYMKTKKRRKK